MSHKNGPDSEVSIQTHLPLLENEKLHRVFNAIDKIIDILEQGNSTGDILGELELTFRLINAEKSNKRYRRQLFHTIKKISDKNPSLASAINDLERIAVESLDSMNFELLVKYGIFCRKNHQRKGFIFKNLAEDGRIRGIVKSRNLANLYTDDE